MAYTPVRHALYTVGFAIMLLTASTVVVGAKTVIPPVPDTKPAIEDMISQDVLAELTNIAPAAGNHNSTFQAQDFNIIWKSARIAPEQELISTNTAPHIPGIKPVFKGSGPLNEEDIARYQHIFAFQDTGDWNAADEEIKKLHDLRLMGHVLYQRYMHPTKYSISIHRPIISTFLTKTGARLVRVSNPTAEHRPIASYCEQKNQLNSRPPISRCDAVCTHAVKYQRQSTYRAVRDVLLQIAWPFYHP